MSHHETGIDTRVVSNQEVLTDFWTSFLFVQNSPDHHELFLQLLAMQYQRSMSQEAFADLAGRVANLGGAASQLALPHKHAAALDPPEEFRSRWSELSQAVQMGVHFRWSDDTWREQLRESALTILLQDAPYVRKPRPSARPGAPFRSVFRDAVLVGRDFGSPAYTSAWGEARSPAILGGQSELELGVLRSVQTKWEADHPGRSYFPPQAAELGRAMLADVSY